MIGYANAVVVKRSLGYLSYIGLYFFPLQQSGARIVAAKEQQAMDVRATLRYPAHRNRPQD